MSRSILLSLFLLLRPCVLFALARQTGPVLTLEPPSLVQFPPSAGVRVACAAIGDPAPAVTWLTDDGNVLHDLHNYRRVYANGTIELLPSSSHLSSATYRCRATNVHGTVLSRDVTLQPVVSEPWSAELTAAAAAAGGVAALRCAGAGAGAAGGQVRAAGWYRGGGGGAEGERLLVDDAVPRQDARYLVAGEFLLVREVGAADAGAYSCLARHRLTGLTRRSAQLTLTVTDELPQSPPRLVGAASVVSAAAGAAVCLPCVCDQQAAHYTWYREVGGRLQPLVPSSAAWLWARGAALCVPQATRALAGAWLCKASTQLGDVTSQTRLDVHDDLTVTVTPTVQTAATGSTVRFNCSASDPAASLRWLHDGAALAAGGGGGGALVLRGAARAHRGMYQCRASRGRDSAQAAAQLLLGDSPPTLLYTFIEQALRAGGAGGAAVSLRCVAAGTPPPTIAWLLDDQPVAQYLQPHRYSVSTSASVSGDVVSVLNISAAGAADGGLYACRATNSRGQATHAARLNIYGPPSIRSMGPLRAVAGSNTTLLCPYAGYPISEVTWSLASGRALPAGGSGGRVSARGAALRLRPALAADAGLYACAVTAPDGQAARREVELQLRNPPKISPFIFSSELTEGSSVQVLCGVISGDKPMYFSWLKDGAPLPTNLQIEEKSLNEFSLLMFSDLTARHSGEYTCKVSNHAATVNFTATLSVKVAPTWTKEPMDTAVLLGAQVLLECEARGYPEPTITWFRRIDEGSHSISEVDQWQELGGGGEVGGGAWGLSSDGADRLRGTGARQLAGLYRCRADNGVGPALLKQVNLTVHEPAHFAEQGGPARNVSLVRGQSATLACEARGDAPLTVHWSRRGRRIDLNSYRWTVSEVMRGAGLRSELRLRAAERGDAGEYRCHADNEYGRSEQLLYLHVEEPPEAPSGLQLWGASSRWVRVRWRVRAAPAAPRPRYTALCTPLQGGAGVQGVTGDAYNLTADSAPDDALDLDGYISLSAQIPGLRPAAAYSLRLAAENHVGQSPHSEPLLFTTLEEAPTGSPQNVRVRPSSNEELLVSWSAPVQDSWNGELLGYAISWRELGRFESSPDEDEARSGTVTSPGWTSSELTVSGLRPFARYAVTIRAYNCAGAGPPSPPVYATTADGVPELSPSEVVCEALSSTTLRVRWASPAGVHTQTLHGFDVHYALMVSSTFWSGPLSSESARVSSGAEATLRGLRAGGNYSVSVRARSRSGAGPSSVPVYCRTMEDVPGAPEAIRAVPSGSDSLFVTWLPPAQLSGDITHYSLYVRELGKVGGEWSVRVEGGGGCAGRTVRGLRRAAHELWLRAYSRAGAGPPSRVVTATPAEHVLVRLVSFGRIVRALIGSRLHLCCAAVGASARVWRPPPPPQGLTDTGDLIIHNVEASTAGNYSCSVRGPAGSDVTTYSVRVPAPPPAPPPPRAAARAASQLQLAWDCVRHSDTLVLGYTVWLSLAAGGAVRQAQVAGRCDVTVRGLACGATYRVTVTAHSDEGVSLHSPPLLVSTRGDKARAPLGVQFIWANVTALRLNLLAWRGCRARYRAQIRAGAGGGAWQELPPAQDLIEASGLRPGTWYEVRVVASSAAGETVALYRAATLTVHGERIGATLELPAEAGGGSHGAAAGAGGAAGAARTAPLLLGGALAAALALLVAAALLLRHRAGRAGAAGAAGGQARPLPHPQLYSTEPSKRNGKSLSPIDDESLHEISPYATFSMAGAACALHRGAREPPGLHAPAPPHPPHPPHPPGGGGCGRRDSDSESSGSPCACALQLYRLPDAHSHETLPAHESSAESTYSAAAAAAAAARARARGRRRRGGGGGRHSAPTARYLSSATLQTHAQSRHDEL